MIYFQLVKNFKRMKKKNLIIKGLNAGKVIFISALLVACQDFLEVTPVSKFSNENIYSHLDYTRQAILGIYQLQTRDEGYSKRLSMYYGVDTDIGMCSGTIDNERRGIARYAANSGNTEIEKPWRNLYNEIERANICIANIPESPLYTDGTEEEQSEMKRMHGEALALRALAYFELVRNWGDVPFKTTPSAAGDEFSLPKTDRDIIYEQIIDDLLLAAELVPWKSEVEVFDERITKGGVKGLLARVCLARGGYSLRREGGMQRGASHIDFYQIARDQCYEIMQSGEHSLNPDFEDVFRTLCELDMDNQYGESMWEIGMGTYTSGEVGYYIGVKQANECRYGRAIAGIQALPTYFLSFDSLDTRRDATVALYEIDSDNKRLIREFADIYVAKWRREWRDPLLPGSDKFTGINWIILRYSDILLMFAEAENEITGYPTPDAINAFRQVRERAFKGNIDKMPPIPTDYNGFFNELVSERAWEFGGECIRKYDLIRWNLLGTKINEAKENLARIANNEPPYENVPPRIVWRNNGENYEILNLNFPMDSAQIADRDTANWPEITDWAVDLTEEYINSIAEFFEPDRKELLPIHQSIVDVNVNLSNDYGY